MFSLYTYSLTGLNFVSVFIWILSVYLCDPPETDMQIVLFEHSMLKERTNPLLLCPSDGNLMKRAGFWSRQKWLHKLGRKGGGGVEANGDIVKI